MSSIKPISNINNKIKQYYNPKNTGYLALGSLGLTTVTAMSKSRMLKKSHKSLAFLTGVFSLLHLETLYHYKIKNFLVGKK